MAYGAITSAQVNEREDDLRRLGRQFDTTHGMARFETLEKLTEEQCTIANSHVKGMDLKSKLWFLRDGDKDMALASVKHKQAAKVDVDFVDGKGRGLILLMLGPPGAGKTLTAEAVAEECHAPLYSMSAGDLGSSPSEVEKSLDNAFKCCALWGALSLLDEADVFLAARSVEGLERNELVSIFLRRLEHYQGVLFLTTDRIQTIDPAFQSRIDLIIPSEPLTSVARKDAWKNFIARTGGPDKFDLSEDDIEKLVNMNLNGREIKNLVKTALILNVEEGGKVGSSHVLKLANMRLRAQKILDS
ncbi:putative AAA+ ATPase domain-containing protein [Seiridium unicorne]|uniref:AAA+ ATPase domain-containing protein n=1 Tax=Seiridium unicorne TaxID=138068 RepID=A0ABR2V2B5_9PEZI